MAGARNRLGILCATRRLDSHAPRVQHHARHWGSRKAQSLWLPSNKHPTHPPPDNTRLHDARLRLCAITPRRPNSLCGLPHGFQYSLLTRPPIPPPRIRLRPCHTPFFLFLHPSSKNTLSIIHISWLDMPRDCFLPPGIRCMSRRPGSWSFPRLVSLNTLCRPHACPSPRPIGFLPALQPYFVEHMDDMMPP